jgi:hypothetical protein
MSCSGGRLLSALAAAAGIGAFALPLVAPWHLLTVLTAAVTVTFAHTGWRRAVVGGLALLAVLLVLRGSLPSPLAAVTLSAVTLAVTGRAAMAIGVLLLNLSAAASAQELLSDLLHRDNLEAAGPAVLACIVLTLASSSRRDAAAAIGSGLVALGVVWLASRAVSVPQGALAFGAMPVILVAAVTAAFGPTPLRAAIPVGGMLLVALATWPWTPPKATGKVWLLLPVAPDTYEAEFFANYIEALRFAGIDAEQAGTPDEIPPGVTVLMPWVTAGFVDDRRIGDLAREQRWTVVIGGEHTNMGEVATRIEAMAGRALLRSDLTVPRGNTDHSGPMHMPAISTWPHESILNRGASVTIGSLADRVLLAGDGWWAEPDIGEWLWAGDYVWRDGERAGRLALAAASDIGGARWVVLGDNSPLVNSQLIADPRAVIRILQAANLRPAFLFDLLLAVLAVMIFIGITPILVAVLPLGATLVTIAADRPSQAWRDFYLGQSGFDQRNFNNVVAANPALVDERRLIRRKAPVSGTMTLPNEPAIMFLLVDGASEIGGVRLDRCQRLGFGEIGAAT